MICGFRLNKKLASIENNQKLKLKINSKLKNFNDLNPYPQNDQKVSSFLQNPAKTKRN